MSSATGGSPFARIDQDDAEREEIRRYWTAERIRAASPVPMPRISRADYERMKHEPAPGPDGLVFLPSGETSPVADPGPVSPTQRPYWNVGVLVSKRADGTGVTCTAAFVANATTLLTVAHGVADPGGTPNRSFQFIQGAATAPTRGLPVSIIGVKSVHYPPQFFQSGSAPWGLDYAILRTDHESYAGWLGLAAPPASPSVLTSVGYPSNYDNGSNMYAVTGEVIGPYTATGSWMEMGGNPFKEGCSGGPWIKDVSGAFNPQANIACGLNGSFFESGVPSMVGPYFGADFMALFNEASAAG